MPTLGKFDVYFRVFLQRLPWCALLWRRQHRLINRRCWHSRQTCKSILQKTKRSRSMWRSMLPCVSESDGDSAGAVGVQCDVSFPGAAEFALIGGYRASNKPAMSAADGTPSRTYSCTRSAMPVGGLGVLLGQMPSRAEAERRTSECISRCSRPLSACRARAQRPSCLVRAISWWFGRRQFGPAHPASDRYGSCGWWICG